MIATTNNQNSKGSTFCPMDSGAIFGLAAATNLVVSIVVVIYAQVMTFITATDVMQTKSFVYGSTVVIQVALLLLWWVYSKARKVNVVAASHLDRMPTWHQSVKTVLFIIALFALALVTEVVLIWLFDVIGYTSAEIPFDGARDLIVMIPIFCILPALSEELIFRGVLLSGLQKNMGKYAAAAVSAACFALIHMNVAQLVYQFVLGFVLALLVQSFRSIIPAMIGHFLSNLMALVNATLYYEQVWYVNEIYLTISGLALAAILIWQLTKSKQPKSATRTDLALDVQDQPQDERTPEAVLAEQQQKQAHDKKQMRLFLIYGIAAAALCVLMIVMDLSMSLGGAA